MSRIFILIVLTTLGITTSHAEDQTTLQLENTGNIKAGTIVEAIITKAPSGASYKVGDTLKGGTISSGKLVTAKLRQLPDTGLRGNYKTKGGEVKNVSGVELSNSTIVDAKVSEAIINGKTVAGEITVDVNEAHITTATIDSVSIPLDEVINASRPLLLVGSIEAGRSLPTDLSGRKVTLKQDDSQYKAFVDIATKENKFCGCGCEYAIKDDDTRDLLVNVESRGDGCNNPLGGGTVENGKDYRVKKVIQESLKYAYKGVTFGVLVVPFKWQFHDHSIAGSASLGPYVGYQLGTSWGGFGVNVIPLASIGLTNLAVQNQANSSSSSNVTGFTLALGAGFSISKSQSSLQGGFVCGQDRAGSSTPTPYKYEGTWWCAAELGFPFTQ